MSGSSNLVSAPAVLRLMGNFSLVIAGEDRSSRLNYEKVRLVLAVLALAQSQPVSRAKLARMIWPDVDVSEGRARVRHVLHTLRQVFSVLPDTLEVDAAQIRLRGDLVQVDVLSLIGDPSTPFQIDDGQRLDWYQPPLLDTPNPPPSEEFHNWLQGWQARIEIEMAQWRHRVIERHVQNEEIQVALAHASRWVEHWPEDESCHRALIRLLIATGQHEAAVLAFEHCSRVLADRLGLEPSAETRSLLGIKAPIAAPAPARRRTYGREFRPLAILAVALKVSSSQRDVEAAVESLELTRSQVMAVMQTQSLRVLQPPGGFLLACFGYPHLSERPIDRAIALARTLSDLSLHENIRLGMGLHADIAVTEPESDTPDVAGLLSQIALSLAWQARHRETLLSQAAVQRLHWHQFLSVKRGGAAEYVLQYQSQSEITPRLHGRSREFDFLVGLWTRQLLGRPPAVVFITGFSGIGKSLLANALAEYAIQSGGQRMVVTCSEDHQTVPLYPLLNWLRQQRDAVAASLRDLRSGEVVERLCDTLGIKHSQAATLESLMEATQMSETLLAQAQEVLGAILARHAVDTQRPRLIVFEDLHWADPATLAFIQQIQQRPARMPLMILGTSRSRLAQEYGTTLRLEPLSERDMAQFVSQRSRTQKLSRKQRQHILEHCLGVPLHALQLMRQTTQDLPLELSSGLTDTLCVEMRRLQPAALEIAQLTALMETRPEIDMLSAVLAMPPEILKDAIACLLDNGILLTDLEGGIDTPILVRLALRRMTPRKTRHQLHTLIARHLIDADAAPALIAPHVESADEPSTPIWWQRAAIQEIHQHQPRRARTYLERALKYAHRIDNSEERRKFEFECQMWLGELAAVTSGLGAEQTLLAYEAASRTMPADNPQAALTAAWGRWAGCQHTARYTEALDLARRHMRLAIELEHEQARAWSHYALGQTYLWCGQLLEAEHQLGQSIAALAKASDQDSIPSGYGEQGVPLVHCTQALCLALQGRTVEALTLSQQALQMALVVGAPMTTVGCVLLSARIHYVVGNTQAAAMVCQGLLSHLPPDDSLSPWYALTHTYAVLPEILQGSNPDALQPVRDALPVIEAGMPTLLNSLLCLIARGLIALHAFDEAAATLAQAEDVNRRQNSFTVEPEIHCLRGDLWLASGQLGQAHKSWHQARASAIRHGLLAYVTWADSRIAEYPATTAA